MTWSGRLAWASPTVVPGDDDRLVALNDLPLAPHLHERGGVPLGLWCRGPLRLSDAVEQSVAVVGSWLATSYGGSVAGEISRVLSRGSRGRSRPERPSASTRRLTAARSPSRGPTVAVLACGADRAYPSAHRSLIDYIADVGLGVWEAAPGVCAEAHLVSLPATG